MDRVRTDPDGLLRRKSRDGTGEGKRGRSRRLALPFQSLTDQFPVVLNGFILLGTEAWKVHVLYLTLVLQAVAMCGTSKCSSFWLLSLASLRVYGMFIDASRTDILIAMILT